IQSKVFAGLRLFIEAHLPRRNNRQQGYPRLDRLGNTMKLQRRRLRRRPPSEAVSFMQQLAGNRLAEAEVMFLPEFDHAPNGFRSRRLSVVGRVRCWRSGGTLNEGEEVLFQGHATG